MGQPSLPAAENGCTPAALSFAAAATSSSQVVGTRDAVVGEELLVVPDALDVELGRQRVQSLLP